MALLAQQMSHVTAMLKLSRIRADSFPSFSLFVSPLFNAANHILSSLHAAIIWCSTPISNCHKDNTKPKKILVFLCINNCIASCSSIFLTNHFIRLFLNTTTRAFRALECANIQGLQPNPQTSWIDCCCFLFFVRVCVYVIFVLSRKVNGGSSFLFVLFSRLRTSTHVWLGPNQVHRPLNRKDSG